MSKPVDPIAAEIGERIRTARKQARLGPDALADALGAHVSTVTSYERGEKWPYKHIRGIAEATNRSVQWLLYGQDFESSLAEIKGQLDQLLAQTAPAPEKGRLADAIRTARERQKPNVPAPPAGNQAPATPRKKGQGGSGS